MSQSPLRSLQRGVMGTYWLNVVFKRGKGITAEGVELPDDYTADVQQLRIPLTNGDYDEVIKKSTSIMYYRE